MTRTRNTSWLWGGRGSAWLIVFSGQSPVAVVSKRPAVTQLPHRADIYLGAAAATAVTKSIPHVVLRRKNTGATAPVLALMLPKT